VVPSNGYAAYPRHNMTEGAYTYAPSIQQGQIQHQQHQIPKSSDNEMTGLDVLVAAATSERNVAPAGAAY
jgi:hypothetical protein